MWQWVQSAGWTLHPLQDGDRVGILQSYTAETQPVQQGQGGRRKVLQAIHTCTSVCAYAAIFGSSSSFRTLADSGEVYRLVSRLMIHARLAFPLVNS